MDPLTEITINHLELTPLHSYECTTRDQNSENEEQVKVHIFETHTESISFLQPSSIYRDWPRCSSPVALVPILMSENTRNSPTPKSKELDNHDAQAHNNNTVICPFCDQTYQDSSILQKHILATHNPGGVVGCKYCNLCFKTIDDQSNHIEYQHNKSCPKCYLCDLTFENFEDLGAHALVHSMQRLNCDLCSWSCTSMIQLNEHKQTTHGQISHVLGYGPSNPPFYTDEETNISCNICGLVLYNRNSWHLHNEYHHSVSSQLATPPFKPPIFSTLEPIYTYPCYSCGLCFYSHEDLDNHMTIHTTLPPPDPFPPAPIYVPPNHDTRDQVIPHGNDSVSSIVDPPNLGSHYHPGPARQAPYTLNRDKQMARLERNSSIDDFTIDVNDPDNVNIQCSSGFYTAVGKPSLSGLLDYAATFAGVPIKCYEDCTPKLDQLNRNINVLLRFKVGAPDKKLLLSIFITPSKRSKFRAKLQYGLPRMF